MLKKILIGCIADDFTGAGDAASFLAKAGMRTVLFNGTPERELLEECDAAVIALKTRSAPVERAVEDSLAGFRWLRRQGTACFFSKYCSTFDSTPQGNIGPVLDALMEELGIPCTVLCPALPVNGRTVRDGVLYVDAVPLSESSMKDHPLNPMWDSSIAGLMKSQSRYPCLKLSKEQMEKGKDSLRVYVMGKMAGKKHFYLIPDHYEEEHADLIVSLFGNLKLLSGGSGILNALGIHMLSGRRKPELFKSRTKGKAIILVGSCSMATIAQIQEFQKSGGRTHKINPLKLISGEVDARKIWDKAMEGLAAEDSILFYSSDPPECVRYVQDVAKGNASAYLERTTAELALLAREAGFTRMIVAGGETSGAVTQALGYGEYWIGESVAPGIPVMIPLAAPHFRLILKSGNFGQADFFLRAVEATGEGEDKLC